MGGLFAHMCLLSVSRVCVRETGLLHERWMDAGEALWIDTFTVV
jgi:hypothetical protein